LKYGIIIWKRIISFNFKNMFKKISFIGTSALAMPFLAFAQTDAGGILATIATLVNRIIPILIALILVFFIYQVVLFVFSEDKRESAKKGMINGVIGLLIVLSIWGIIGVIQNTFNIGAGGTVTEDLIPGVQL